MFCVLPEADHSVDVTIHLQQTLISAYCREHGIRVIKVSLDNVVLFVESKIEF